MSKMIVDETEWCQHEHYLKRYALLTKAIDWRNACVQNLMAHHHYHEKAFHNLYIKAHDMSGIARTFLDILTGHPLATLSLMNSKRARKIEKQLRAVLA